jgi:hypothetical protein
MYGGIGYKVVNADDNNISTYKFGNDKIRNYNDKYEDQKNYLDYSFTGYDCTKVYPEYLAYLDAKEYLKNDENGPKNLHRCEWSKKCGVPWTEAGCE